MVGGSEFSRTPRMKKKLSDRFGRGAMPSLVKGEFDHGKWNRNPINIERTNFIFANLTLERSVVWTVSVPESDFELVPAYANYFEILLTHFHCAFILCVACTLALFWKKDHGILLTNGDLLIGKMRVSRLEIGQGSNGTIVYEGSFDGHQVVVKNLTVKRVLKSDSDLEGNREIDVLKWVPTSSCFFGVEEDYNFIYIAIRDGTICDCDFSV